MQVKVAAAALVYPVLTVSRRGELQVFDEAQVLQKANVLALRNGFFTDMLVIESSGASYRVAEVDRLGWTGGFFGFRFLQPRLYRVQLGLVSTNVIDLVELKQIVLDALRKMPEPWEGTGPISGLMKRVRAATAIEQIFQILHD